MEELNCSLIVPVVEARVEAPHSELATRPTAAVVSNDKDGVAAVVAAGCGDELASAGARVIGGSSFSEAVDTDGPTSPLFLSSVPVPLLLTVSPSPEDFELVTTVDTSSTAP